MFRIGEKYYSEEGANTYWAGAIDEFRVTKAARWTGETFTVPAAPAAASQDQPDFTKLAQSFEVTADNGANVEKAQLYLKKTGTLSDAAMTVRVETDDGGKPSGNLASAGHTATLDKSALGTDYALHGASFTGGDAAKLDKGTYWLVAETGGGSAGFCRTAVCSTPKTCARAAWDASASATRGGRARPSTGSLRSW